MPLLIIQQNRDLTIASRPFEDNARAGRRGEQALLQAPRPHEQAAPLEAETIVCRQLTNTDQRPEMARHHSAQPVETTQHVGRIG